MSNMDLSGKRILVVEDEFLVASSLETLLGDAGAEVAVANKASDAITTLRGSRFDAAILDVHLADQSSYGVADELRSQNAPFVFLSGYLTVREGYADVPFLTKPFTDDTVIAAMSNLLLSPASPEIHR